MNCYFEAQVTLDTGSSLGLASKVGEGLKFDTDWRKGTLSRKFTWHREAKDGLRLLVRSLNLEGIAITAYRFSEVLVDSDVRDMFCLLDNERPLA